MASVNKVILIGHLGQEVQIRYMPNGDAVARINLATTDTWKDKNSGEKKQATEWHRLVIYRKLAEIAGQYLKKGSQIYIEGRLRTQKWTDKQDIERYTTEIVVDTLQMLGRKDSSDQQSSNCTTSATGTDNYNGSFDDDDIPF